MIAACLLLAVLAEKAKKKLNFCLLCQQYSKKQVDIMKMR